MAEEMGGLFQRSTLSVFIHQASKLEHLARQMKSSLFGVNMGEDTLGANSPLCDLYAL